LFSIVRVLFVWGWMMRLQELSRCLCSRVAGIVLVGAAILGGAVVASPVAAQTEAKKARDPRFPSGSEAYSQLIEGRVWVVAEGNYYSHPPARCSIELSFSADYANDDAIRRRQTNPVAVLKRLEMGYELLGDPRDSTDLHAFLRMRFVRVDNGAPLRVEHIVFDYKYDDDDRNKVTSPSTAHWRGQALDADGYGKISIPVAAMDRVEIRDFNVALHIYSPVVAVTLPELGEDRAYAIPTAATLGLKPALNACTCAFRNPRLNDRFVMNCAAPLIDPK
jgi:hypothetical protein